MCFSVIDYTPAAVLFESCSLKACSIQPPGPQSAALFGNRVLADVISVVTMRSYWVRVAPDAVTGVPETDTRGRQPCGHRGSGMMRLQAKGHQRPAEHGWVPTAREGPAAWRRAKLITAPTSRGRSPPLHPPSRHWSHQGKSKAAELSGHAVLRQTDGVRFGGSGLRPHATGPLPTPHAACGRTPLPPGV